MKNLSTLAAGVIALGLACSPANAQATRTFVSPTGNDASPTCSLTAPCRTFAAAYALTNAGGEIAVLGTAGYGTLTISKAISIVNGGGFEAGIAIPSGGTGVTINAGTNDAVSLRGLSIEGGGVGAAGILFNTGASLTVENCVIRHMTGDGIDFLPNATSNLAVSSTRAADNGNSGIFVLPTGAGTVTAVLNRVEVNNNGLRGIDVDGSNSTGTINASVDDSVAARNGAAGFVAFSGPAPTTLMLFHSVAANNGIGIEAVGTGTTLRVAHSMVTGNTNGWLGQTGTVRSAGDNTIEGNANFETAPLTYTLK
jgi:hypothetical protein